MNTTVKDYQHALDGFVEDVGRIGDDVTSVVLFGSMARGDIIPGQSDMMDAYVFLRHEVFEDKARFINALEVLSEAFDRIGENAPGPFHPFFYWDENDPVPATFNCEITKISKVVFGDDIRDRIESTAPGRLMARTSFFEMRRLGLPMMVYFYRKELTEEDCQTIFKLLVTIRRDMPISACMALDIWVGQMNAVRELENALPGLDAGVIERIAALQLRPQPAADPEELRGLVRQVMVFVENLNDRLLARPGAETRS
ncbi:MAG TPA: nucleotidyltransferase domain-containing protein [Blastocatellia bacterium]|jgi:predicted nucleotidyltransferase|nr:nucleotidyltransferase domain-containing protein [Blastocatellia bacterium]